MSQDLIDNSYIYKECLKTICCSLIENDWKIKMSYENIKTSLKTVFDEIYAQVEERIEEADEDFGSSMEMDQEGQLKESDILLDQFLEDMHETGGSPRLTMIGKVKDFGKHKGKKIRTEESKTDLRSGKRKRLNPIDSYKDKVKMSITEFIKNTVKQQKDIISKKKYSKSKPRKKSSPKKVRRKRLSKDIRMEKHGEMLRKISGRGSKEMLGTEIDKLLIPHYIGSTEYQKERERIKPSHSHLGFSNTNKTVYSTLKTDKHKKKSKRKSTLDDVFSDK